MRLGSAQDPHSTEEVSSGQFWSVAGWVPTTTDQRGKNSARGRDFFPMGLSRNDSLVAVEVS